jgi:hypothetical protein
MKMKRTTVKSYHKANRKGGDEKLKRKKTKKTNQGLTVKQLTLVLEVLQGTNIVEISRKTGIPRSTIYHELKKPGVKEALELLKWLLYRRNLMMAQVVASKAWDTLGSLMDSQIELTRLKASEVVLKASSGQNPAQPPKAPLPKIDLEGEHLTLEKIHEIQAELIGKAIQGEMDKDSLERTLELLADFKRTLINGEVEKRWSTEQGSKDARWRKGNNSGNDAGHESQY